MAGVNAAHLRSPLKTSAGLYDKAFVSIAQQEKKGADPADQRPKSKRERQVQIMQVAMELRDCFLGSRTGGTGE